MSTAASEEWTVVPARERKRAKPRVSDGCGRGKCSKNPNLQRQQETARAISASDPQGVGIERENVITARIADVLHPLIVHSRVYKHIIDLVHGETFESLMVLGVGRLTSDASVLQTALALALFRWMVARNPRAECAVCDPVLTPSDTSILIRLGLKVDDINRKGKISCSNKTLFFMPHCPYRLYSNVLWANWGQGLANVTILGNSFESYRLRRIATIVDDPSDCIRLLASITRERCVWKSDVDGRDGPRALEGMGAALNDLSLLDFPVDVVFSDKGKSFSSESACCMKPTEEAIDEASLLDRELF